MLKLDTACGIVATRMPQWQDNSLTFCDPEEALPTTILDDNRFAASSAARREILKAHQILATFDRCRTRATADFRAKIRSHARLLGLTVSD